MRVIKQERYWGVGRGKHRGFRVKLDARLGWIDIEWEAFTLETHEVGAASSELEGVALARACFERIVPAPCSVTLLERRTEWYESKDGFECTLAVSWPGAKDDPASVKWQAAIRRPKVPAGMPESASANGYAAHWELGIDVARKNLDVLLKAFGGAS